MTSPSTLTFTKSDIDYTEYGSSFDFVVTATSDAGTSVYSSSLTVKAVDPPSKPEAPTRLAQDSTSI